MRIAICDENRADAYRIRSALMDTADGLETVYFGSGVPLVAEMIKGGRFDLVFLDVYIGEEDGIEIARRIRELSPKTELIFTTGSRDHAVEAFRVRAADYLVKPYGEIDIVRAFARASVRLREQLPEPVVLTVGRDISVFRADEVTRLESDLHYTKIITAGGEVRRVHIKFSEAAERFGSGFIEIRRGVSVNMAFIEGISGTTVRLTDGSSFTLTASRRNEVVESYKAYLAKNN